MADPAEVTVWHVDLGRAATALLQLEEEVPRLSAGERERAAKIRDSVLSRQWLAAHVALRLALERCLGPSVRSRDYVTSAGGKPALARSNAAMLPAVAFSLSHTRGQALVAIGPDGPLGVDLEMQRTVRLAALRRQQIEIAGAGLSATPLPGDELGRFLQAWVRLEALAKADGEGLAKVLTRAGAFGGRRGAGAAPDLLPPGRQVHDLALGDGLYGAIASATDVTGVRVGQMPDDVATLRVFALG